MSASELLKKVRQIEIKTKGLSNHIFAENTILHLKELEWFSQK